MNPEPTTAPSANRSLGDLPASPEVMAAFEKHRQQIKDTAGSALACLALYGGVVRGRYQPGNSDINMVLIVNEMTSELLSKVAPVLRAAWLEIRLEPFLLARNELARTCVVFPTKMLDIKRFHRVLDGEDLLSKLEIRREDLCLRIEQELRNLAMRLRRRFLAIEHDQLALERALLDTAIPLRVALFALLDLAEAEPTDKRRTAAIYVHAAERFKLDAAALAKLSALRDTGASPGDVKALYLSILQVVTRAAELVTEAGCRS